MEHLNEELKNELENLQPKVILFDSFEFNTNQDVDYFINNLTTEDSNNCIIQSVVSAYKRGAFSMIESEVISKSLRILNK